MDDYSKILEYLREQGALRPELREVVDLHIALLTAQSQVEVAASPEAGAARASLEQGQPLLQPQQVQVDWGGFQRLFDQVCLLSAQRRPDLSGAFEEMRALAERVPSRLRALAQDYLADARGYIRQAGSLSLNGELLDFVLNNALHPFLRAQAAALAPRLDDDLWQLGYCPVCGSEPDLAAFEKDTGARRLLCSRCDTEWAFKRLACPFCSNQDPRRLAHYPGEAGRYRLDVCEACRRYLKTVDGREAWREVSLPAERVLTAGMDLAAAGEGYH